MDLKVEKPQTTLGLLIALTALYVVALLGLEWKTLADRVPDNHITAVVRAAWKSQPWVFLLLGMIAAYFGGHFFAAQ